MVVRCVYAGREDSHRPCSPYSITRNVLDYLRRRGLTVKYYDWQERGQRGVTDVGEDDIILGHPSYEPDSILRWMFANTPRCRAKCTIHPFAHAMPELNSGAEPLVAQADRIFAISGPYWLDTIDQSPFAHWKSKIVRLDMAIDAGRYPFLKERFNPPGRRGLVYIGREGKEKGTDILYRTVERLPQMPFYYYGSLADDSPLRRLPNFHGGVKVHTEDLAFARRLAADADIFVTFGRSDANPTTLLESAAWGLIPCCTRTSGYYEGERCDNVFTELFADDIDRNARILTELNHAPEGALRSRNLASRQVIEQKYNWPNFCQRLWEGLAPWL